MVKSTVVGITPANHASSHLPAGTDPLDPADFPHAPLHMGGSDEIMGISGSIVFNGTSPNATWTDLDLSSYVGAYRTLVVLKVINNEGAAAIGVSVKPKGDTNTFGTNLANASGLGVINTLAGTCDWVSILTDTDGFIQWWSSAAHLIAIQLMSYIRIED